ncbi:LytR/AlgR family response regulator transcription factor [Bifidobacterium eulemuris]|uniref:DNA-binding response regulator n=1 Tax=Bifidobacterium eulemuris TaxID=1765219 RepID=A0A261G1J5_9BIFI|nr:LytTR family DNA-binding domain-containing protein [Bifidobacterium eulemuris]OZG65258.1 DNA-binding response regulator [Bifidobacterium eulemuris]QOL32324.1 response regulator transcription factor [Bifidobacterium eulemuris]
MLTVAIVEDDDAAADKLRACLDMFAQRTGNTFDVRRFVEPTSFLEGYKPSWDIVFMDIEMPNMDGLVAAHRLRELDGGTVLIFVTNMAQFAAKGYEVDALDYIIKPFSYADFERKIARAVKLCDSESDDSVIISQRGGSQRIRLRDVSYVEVRGHSLEFHTENGVVAGTGSLQEAEAKLKPHGFLRCGKPYLVNQRHIDAIKGNEVRLSDGGSLPIGRAFRKSFLQDLADNLGDDRWM